MPTKLKRPASRPISVEPMTPSAFAPFGTVIQNPAKASFPIPLPSTQANQGSATKTPDVSPLVSSYELSRSKSAASPRISLFSCKPRQLDQNAQGQQVFDVKILERHPFTPQTFIPTGLSADDKETAYLVVVAPTLQSGSQIPSAFADDSKPRTTQSSRPASNAVAEATATPKSSGPPDLGNVKAFIARGDQAVTYGAGTWHAPMVVLGKQTIDFVVVQYMNDVGPEDCQEAELYDGRLDVMIADDLISARRAAKL